jgi:membrane-associated protease RseP (regulator of RpoE activity)
MKLDRCLIAGSLAAVIGAGHLLAQDEPVQLQIRTVTNKDGKVEVVEKRIVGAEKTESDKKGRAPQSETTQEEIEIKDNEKGKGRVIRRLHGLAGNVLDQLEAAADAPVSEWGEMPASDYWIGVQIGPVPAEVRKHMAVKHGILVLHVFPDSPADKAGIRVDDILLQAGDTKIETGPDLVHAVNAAETKEVKFKILREGKETSLAVTPVKREEAEPSAITQAPDIPARMERLRAAQKRFEEALEALRAETGTGGAVDFMLVRPGAFMARALPEQMPDDLTIQITKEGNKTAKIHVEKGDKSWDVTADNLSDLPDEIRPFVEQMVARPPTVQWRKLDTHVQGVPAVPPMVAPFAQGVPAVPPVPGRPTVTWSPTLPHQATDAKLDQILKKLDAIANPNLEGLKKELQSLRKEVEELRKKNTGAEPVKEG